MATLQNFSLLKNLVNETKKNKDFDEESYAFIFKTLEALYKDEDNVEEFITDGPNDGGLDACYVDFEKREVDIFQFKYTEKFEKHKESVIDSAPAEKMYSFISDVWNKEGNLLEYLNSYSKDSVERIWTLLEGGPITTRLHFYTNLANPVPERREKADRKKFKDDLDVDVYFYGIEDVLSLIFNKRIEQKNANIQFSGKNYFEKNESDIQSFVGVVNTKKFFDAILDDDGGLPESIFDENVRMYLQRRGDINKQIFSTATSSENYKFFYFNNGITIVCDKLKASKGDSPVVKVENMQIVNGSQTVHALYDAYINPNFKETVGDDTYFLVRIYGVEDKEIGQRIATYTNSQNPVKSRDIRSNDLRQIKLEEDLKTKNYLYSRKKGQYSNVRLNKNKLIDSEKIGQLILAFYEDKPGSAKNKKRDIFGNLYPVIFNEDKITAEYAILPFEVFRAIEEEVNKARKKKSKIRKSENKAEIKNFREKEEYILHGSYYVLYATKLIAQKKGIKVDLANKTKILKLVPQAMGIIKKFAYKQVEDKLDELPVIFKTDDYTSTIREQVFKMK